MILPGNSFVLFSFCLERLPLKYITCSSYNKSYALSLLYIGKKYEIIYKHDLYTTNMMMTVHTVNPEDYGTYICVSINPLGNTDGIIKLYGKLYISYIYI